MSDLIDRGTAINALDELCDRVCEYGEKHRSVMCVSCPLGSAFDVLENLSTPQPDCIRRQAVIDSLHRRFRDGFGEDKWWNSAIVLSAINETPSAQPEQKTEELLPDGTLHLVTDADLSNVGRVLVSQSGTHYVGVYYADGEPKPSAQPELIRPKARDVYYEETDHCEFKCSLCGATIGVVEGGTLDGANFKFCPWCGAEMEGWCERPD